MDHVCFFVSCVSHAFASVHLCLVIAALWSHASDCSLLTTAISREEIRTSV